MSFEQKTSAELVQLAGAGGGFTLEATHKTTAELVQIAGAARHSGARVTFTGLAQRAQAELVQIAGAGGGNVILEE